MACVHADFQNQSDPYPPPLAWAHRHSWAWGGKTFACDISIAHLAGWLIGLMCTSSKLITTSGLVTETGHICPEGGWSPTSPEPPGQVALESTSESPPRAGYALLCMVIYDRKRYAFLIHGVLIAPYSRLIPRAANIYHRTMRPRPVLSALKLHPCEFTTASASAASAKEPTTRHADPLSHTDTRWTRWPSYD
jgi:hypothetical protein